MIKNCIDEELYPLILSFGELCVCSLALHLSANSSWER